MATEIMFVATLCMAALMAAALLRGVFPEVKAALETKAPACMLRRKSDGVSTLVVAIVLIVVAVALCIIFRDKLSTFMSSIFDKLNTKTDGLWS